MKSKEVLRLLQVTRKTLSRYVKTKVVLVDSKINGQYVYNDDSVFKLIGKVKYKKIKLIFHTQEFQHLFKRINLKNKIAEFFNHVILKI